MKKWITIVACFGAWGSAAAAPLKSASVTKVVNDVKVSERASSPRSANVGQRLGGSSTLLTGRESRAELTFQDQTITRIGANSVFRFGSGSRDMEIERGSFLLQVPKNAGGARIRTATVTAAITGTTTMMEFSPGQWIKFIVLEGSAHLTNRNGRTIAIPPGQMLVMHPDAENFPKPVTINIKKLVQTSRLMDRKTFGDLNAPAVALIDQSVEQQMVERRGGNLLPSGVIVSGAEIGDGGKGRNIQAEARTVVAEVDDQARKVRDEAGRIVGRLPADGVGQGGTVAVPGVVGGVVDGVGGVVGELPTGGAVPGTIGGGIPGTIDGVIGGVPGTVDGVAGDLPGTIGDLPRDLPGTIDGVSGGALSPGIGLPPGGPVFEPPAAR